ncbi:hypothetical protein RYX36_036552 [Vicia faba]
MENQNGPHLVLIPPPFHGHMTPMLQLATVLHSKGFSVTIAHTHFNSPDSSNHPNFNFLPFFDGLSSTQITSKNFVDIASTLSTNCVAPLKETLIHHMAKLEKNDEKIAYSKSLDLVPELELLLFKDLPIFNLRNPHDFLHCTSKNLSITPLAVIFNTMQGLEDSSLIQLQKLHKINLFPVGPLHMIANEFNNISILRETDGCISWLNSKARKSVLYVSLGSIASWEEKELTEMACGLANSGQSFVWVIRPETVNNVSEWLESLSEDVKLGVTERGWIVKWAPQSEVLAHEAVGGFWSHCGWNSTLESLCE